MADNGWLDGSVIYQIFMSSFADGDGDGIGDLAGAVEHLDHLPSGLGSTPSGSARASPHRSATRDTTSRITTRSRPGTEPNDDMTAFVAEAGRRGIRVLLDLVAGHTSVEHPWFPSLGRRRAGDDRYIWSDRPGPGFVPSPGRRPGSYLKNFFDEQPALNFGYARTDQRPSRGASMSMRPDRRPTAMPCTR